jgi:RNA polymerase sigma-32 factor
MSTGGGKRGRRGRKPAAESRPAALEPEIVADHDGEEGEPAIDAHAGDMPAIDDAALEAAARAHADDASPDDAEPRASARRRARGRDGADADRGDDGEKDGALVSFDPLQRYLAEIRRHPLLSREEEHDLAVRFQHDRDIEAAYRLVTGNLRLVVMIAREYQRSFRNLLDLIQEGNIGLMEAVKNFDPYRGVRFPSYAVWWIRAYIIRYVMNNWRLVKLGTTQAQRKLFFNLQKEKDKLEAEGFVAGPKLLAQRLDVKEKEVVEMEQRLGGSDVSVDSPLHEGEEGTLLDVLKSGAATAEDQVAEAEYRRRLNEKIREFGSTLRDKDRLIFDQRLLAEEPLTLQEIGDKYGISRERVRQVESRLKRRLKEYLAAQFEDLRDVS